MWWNFWIAFWLCLPSRNSVTRYSLKFVHHQFCSWSLGTSRDAQMKLLTMLSRWHIIYTRQESCSFVSLTLLSTMLICFWAHVGQLSIQSAGSCWISGSGMSCPLWYPFGTLSWRVSKCCSRMWVSPTSCSQGPWTAVAPMHKSRASGSHPPSRWSRRGGYGMTKGDSRWHLHCFQCWWILFYHMSGFCGWCEAGVGTFSWLERSLGSGWEQWGWNWYGRSQRGNIGNHVILTYINGCQYWIMDYQKSNVHNVLHNQGANATSTWNSVFDPPSSVFWPVCKMPKDTGKTKKHWIMLGYKVCIHTCGCKLTWEWPLLLWPRESGSCIQHLNDHRTIPTAVWIAQEMAHENQISKENHAQELPVERKSSNTYRAMRLNWSSSV